MSAFAIVLLVLLALFSSRALLVSIYVLTDWFALHCDTILLPVLGLLFAPNTTLTWLACVMNGSGVEWCLLVCLGVLADLFCWINALSK